MIEESAVVIDVNDQGVWVETIKKSACQSCAAANGCGQKLLVSASDNKRFMVNVSNPKNVIVKKDDQVLIGIEEGAFVKATLLIYLVPLLFLIMGALLADQLLLTEPYIILSAVLSFVFGLLLARYGSRWLSRSCRYQPLLLKVI